MRDDDYKLRTDSEPFFRIHELMFLPKEKGEERSSKYVQEVEKEIVKLKEYCIKYLRKSPNGSRLITPRAYRIHNDYIIANLEPVLARASFVANNCNRNSVGEYYYIIQDYYNGLSKPYVGTEMTQAIVGQMCFGVNSWQSYEQEPIYCFNKKRGTIITYDEAHYGLSESEYKKIDDQLNANIADSQCAFLRIGRFSTKEDIKWFIDNYWDKITRDMPKTKRCKNRMTEKRLRTLLTDCMLACGLKTGDIIGIIDRVFPILEKDYADAHAGSVEKGTIEKAKKELKKRLEADAFNEAFSDLLSLRGKQELSANPTISQRKDYLRAEVKSNDGAIRTPLKFRVTNSPMTK